MVAAVDELLPLKPVDFLVLLALFAEDRHGYGIVQDIVFDLKKGKTLPVDTHAYLSSAEDTATARQYIDMAEQTCFLHGACRMSNKTRLTIA